MFVLTGECPKVLRILELEKGSKSDNFRTNLVEFRVGKGPFQFVTQCFIGHSPVNEVLMY